MRPVSEKIVSRFADWWDGVNKEPLISVSYEKKNADINKYLKPWMEGRTGWIFARAVIKAHSEGDRSYIDDALDIMELELNCTGFAGDGYPLINLNTGAGCAAAFISEYARFYNETVWFELDTAWDYDKIISLPENHTTEFAETTLEAVKSAAKRFSGGAVLTTLDLGGLADILSSLRRTDGFLYDMADRPDDVKAALKTIRAVWKNFYGRMTAITGPANNGLYASWTGALSDSPYYPSQCDACAMISKEMFDEFIWPTLSAEISSYEKTLYHLDGSGEIVHLDTLCKNPSLRAIQWVPEPAAGHADISYHLLYENIIGRGRKIIFNGFNGSHSELVELLNKFPREAFYLTLTAENYGGAMRLLESLG